MAKTWVLAWPRSPLGKTRLTLPRHLSITTAIPALLWCGWCGLCDHPDSSAYGRWRMMEVTLVAVPDQWYTRVKRTPCALRSVWLISQRKRDFSFFLPSSFEKRTYCYCIVVQDDCVVTCCRLLQTRIAVQKYTVSIVSYLSLLYQSLQPLQQHSSSERKKEEANAPLLCLVLYLVLYSLAQPSLWLLPLPCALAGRRLLVHVVDLRCRLLVGCINMS